mmetsp:Transcript_60799/g.157146  ORF Transcript_60799/g.157146 Transcript_60799/m.157146 type:complete len:202 (+) Transcript_60799:632-1237(+)
MVPGTTVSRLKDTRISTRQFGGGATSPQGRPMWQSDKRVLFRTSKGSFRGQSESSHAKLERTVEPLLAPRARFEFRKPPPPSMAWKRSTVTSASGGAEPGASPKLGRPAQSRASSSANDSALMPAVNLSCERRPSLPSTSSAGLRKCSSSRSRTNGASPSSRETIPSPSADSRCPNEGSHTRAQTAGCGQGCCTTAEAAQA